MRIRERPFPRPAFQRRTNTGTLLMGQDLVRFAAEDDAGHAAPTMRSHADQIAFLFLRHGNNLRVDIVALHQYGVQRDTRGAGEILDSSEGLSEPRPCAGSRVLPPGCLPRVSPQSVLFVTWRMRDPRSSLAARSIPSARGRVRCILV